MSQRLKGKVVLITGGGTGIGAATARCIAREGGKVVLTGRRLKPISALAEELGGLAVAGDTTDSHHLQDAVAQGVARFGGLDALVTSAGRVWIGSVTGHDLDAWNEALALNTSGAMLACRAAIPAMLKRGGGAIVHVGSVAAIRATPDFASYMTTKAALVGLSRSVALDYGPQGIRSNVVSPGLVRTEMAEKSVGFSASALGASVEEMWAQMVRYYPLRRSSEPEEIAATVAFLVSDAASSITGVELAVDCGASIVDVAALNFGANAASGF